MRSIGDYEMLDLSDAVKWNRYLQRLSTGRQDIYFTPEYYKLYENLGDGNAKCFVFEKKEDIALYPFLINAVNDLGYDLDKEYSDIQGAYGYNGIISSSNKSEFISSFYVAFDDFILKNNIIVEFTRFHPLLKNYKFSKGFMDISFDRKTLFIDLSRKYEDIFKTFQTTTRKQIKRCFHKYNLNVDIIENDVTHLDIFYSIYEEAMDRVQSAEQLYFNIKYFNDLILNTKSALFISRYEGRPISAIIVFYNKKYVHGHLGGALTDYLYTSSLSLLYSEIIKFGIEKKCGLFHAGGGNTSSINDKLLQFKLNFSNSTADFYIGKKIHNKPVYNKVVKQWIERYPEKVEKYRGFLLKYRF